MSITDSGPFPKHPFQTKSVILGFPLCRLKPLFLQCFLILYDHGKVTFSQNRCCQRNCPFFAFQKQPFCDTPTTCQKTIFAPLHTIYDVKNTNKTLQNRGKQAKIILEQLLTFSLDQFLTYEIPNLRPILTLQHIFAFAFAFYLAIPMEYFLHDNQFTVNLIRRPPAPKLSFAFTFIILKVINSEII